MVPLFREIVVGRIYFRREYGLRHGLDVLSIG
jgi:hypothetical protein